MKHYHSRSRPNEWEGSCTVTPRGISMTTQWELSCLRKLYMSKCPCLESGPSHLPSLLPHLTFPCFSWDSSFISHDCILNRLRVLDHLLKGTYLIKESVTTYIRTLVFSSVVTSLSRLPFIGDVCFTLEIQIIF